VSSKCRLFISYDYDHDGDIKTFLVGQSRRKDSPFFIEDWSIKVASRDWRSKARSRIRRADLVLVLCGYYTHQAIGVGKEIKIAKEEGTPYALLKGRKKGTVRRPPGTWFWETIHPWEWETLRRLTTR
jgi:hypothetical protein